MGNREIKCHIFHQGRRATAQDEALVGANPFAVAEKFGDLFNGGFGDGARVNAEDVGLFRGDNRITLIRKGTLPTLGFRLIQAATEDLEGDGGFGDGGIHCACSAKEAINVATACAASGWGSSAKAARIWSRIGASE